MKYLVTVNSKPFSSKVIYKTDPKIPRLILEEMLKFAENLDFVRSKTDDTTSNNARTSSNYWLQWDTWIAGIMHNIFISANNDYFHYDLDHFESGIQVTKYEVGQKYNWHQDMGEAEGPRSRKLSMSLLLTDNFDGGELEIYDVSICEKVIIPLKAGEVAVFPSWIPHRVKPVTAGRRISLVAWMKGPYFK